MSHSPADGFGWLPRSALRGADRFARRLLRAAPEQNGSGLVETAIVLPIFLLIVFGFIQYSIILFSYCNATYACRAASRYASMHSSSSLAPDTVSQVQGLVTSRLFMGTAITPTVSVNYYTQTLSPGSNVVGNLVQVSVTWTQNVQTPFMNATSFSISTQDYRVITR